jgi:hypothetical protein
MRLSKIAELLCLPIFRWSRINFAHYNTNFSAQRHSWSTILFWNMQCMVSNWACSELCPLLHAIMSLSYMNMYKFPQLKSLLSWLRETCFGNYLQCSPYLLQVINFASFFYLLVVLISFALNKGQETIVLCCTGGNVFTLGLRWKGVFWYCFNSPPHPHTQMAAAHRLGLF